MRTSRSWDCTCRIGTMAGTCPVHALVRQPARLDSLAAHLAVPLSSLPLFPNSLGAEPSKHAIVSTILRLAELAGQQTRSADGSYLLGGHFFRTGGASMLASRGVHRRKIQPLGQWRSPLVVLYAGDTMSAGLAADMADRCSGRQSSAG